MSCYPIASFKPAIPRACGPSMGGLRNIYVAVFSQSWPHARASFVQSQVLDSNVSFAPVGGIGNGYWALCGDDLQDFAPGAIIAELVDNPDKRAEFYRIDVSRTGAEINATTEVNEENNSSTVETVITIPVSRISPEGVSVINHLMRSPCLVVAEDWGGHLIPVGLESPARISSATLETGAQPGDRAGETFQVRAYSAGLPPVTLAEYGAQPIGKPEGNIVTPDSFREIFLAG